MDSKNVLLPLYTLLLLLSFAACDIDKDKEKCANDLVGLATCLPYVKGDAKAPPVDCCSGLKQVLHKSPECICLLVKDRDDPSLGLKINATLALSLPSQCHAPANISECPALLHLPPNSPDAKVFEEFANSAKKGNATAPESSSSGKTIASPARADEKNGGAEKRRWLAIEMVLVAMVVVMVHNWPNL